MPELGGSHASIKSNDQQIGRVLRSAAEVIAPRGPPPTVGRGGGVRYGDMSPASGIGAGIDVIYEYVALS